MKIVLTKKTVSEIRKLLNKITIAGIFAIDKVSSATAPSLTTESFESRVVWKEKRVVKVPRKHVVNNPMFATKKQKSHKLLMLVEYSDTFLMLFERPGPTIEFFAENDVFHFNGTDVLIEKAGLNIKNKFELIKISCLAKKPLYSEEAIALHSACEQARDEEFFFIESSY